MDRFAEIPLSLRCCSLCTCTRDTRNIIKRLRIEGKNVYLSEMKWKILTALSVCGQKMCKASPHLVLAPVSERQTTSIIVTLLQPSIAIVYLKEKTGRTVFVFADVRFTENVFKSIRFWGLYIEKCKKEKNASTNETFLKQWVIFNISIIYESSMIPNIANIILLSPS